MKPKSKLEFYLAVTEDGPSKFFDANVEKIFSTEFLEDFVLYEELQKEPSLLKEFKIYKNEEKAFITLKATTKKDKVYYFTSLSADAFLEPLDKKLGYWQERDKNFKMINPICNRPLYSFDNVDLKVLTQIKEDVRQMISNFYGGV